MGLEDDDEPTPVTDQRGGRADDGGHLAGVVRVVVDDASPPACGPLGSKRRRVPVKTQPVEDTGRVLVEAVDGDDVRGGRVEGVVATGDVDPQGVVLPSGPGR